MVSFRLYPEASAACVKEALLTSEAEEAVVKLPEAAKPGDKIHVIVKAQAAGHYKLAYYQQVIISILGK